MLLAIDRGVFKFECRAFDVMLSRGDCELSIGQRVWTAMWGPDKGEANGLSFHERYNVPEIERTLAWEEVWPEVRRRIAQRLSRKAL